MLNKTKQNKAEQNKAKQSKAKQSKARQGKTKQNGTEQNKNKGKNKTRMINSGVRYGRLRVTLCNKHIRYL